MNTEQTDERGGWTSASNAAADELCPGRHRAQLGIPETEASEDAKRGNRIHAWLAGEPVQLDDDEQHIANECRRIEEQIVAELLPDCIPFVVREKRLWITLSGGIKHSGKPDVVVHGRRDGKLVAIIIDYKTGRNSVDDPDANLQLRDLAVLLRAQSNIPDIPSPDMIYTAIVQPLEKYKAPCLYDEQSLSRAFADIVDRVMLSNHPMQARFCGPIQCKHCRAKATCPEFANATKSVVQAQPEKPLSVSIAGMDNADLGRFLRLLRQADDIADAEIRRRLEAGEHVEGWTLKPGASPRSITDPQTVFERLHAKGTTLEAFTQSITLPISAVKQMTKDATGLKGAELEEAVEEIIGGCYDQKQNKPSLKQI